MQPRFHVDAFWDSEAGVWVATSEDVPGLATEADTIEKLTEKLRRLVPELLVANALLSDQEASAAAFELTAHRSELVAPLS